MMRTPPLLILMMLSVALPAAGALGCSQAPSVAQTNVEAGNVADRPKNTRMKITIGSKVYNATLFKNRTAEAFKALLPLTLDMEELNGNEKKFDLAEPLPDDASNPKTISSGDLMIWGRNTVVLFYKSLPTSYSYTRLGRIEDPAGLENAVGKGNVKVTFELDRSPKE
jgi:hypothetical protein